MPARIGVDCASAADGIPSIRSIRRWVRAALAVDTDAELCVRIVDEDEMKALNSRYRGKNYAANVLSFPAEVPPELGIPLLGDIVVCAPVVHREARSQGKKERAHWAHLLIHGTLHLLGHDHRKAHAAVAMESLETRILATLGISDPYEEQREQKRT